MDAHDGLAFSRLATALPEGQHLLLDIEPGATDAPTLRVRNNRSEVLPPGELPFPSAGLQRSVATFVVTAASSHSVLRANGDVGAAAGARPSVWLAVALAALCLVSMRWAGA